MKRWEYKFASDVTAKELCQSKLIEKGSTALMFNYLGALGWEFCEKVNTVNYIFKRELIPTSSVERESSPPVAE